MHLIFGGSVAAEADARSAVQAGPTHFAAFKALAVALGKKSRYVRMPL